MIQISRKILEIDYYRKLDLINKANEINTQYDLIHNEYKKAYQQFGTLAKIDKTLSIFRKNYKDDNLNDNERAFFALYIVFNDDDKFLKMCRTYKYDHKKVASLYSLNEICSYLRYKNIMMMRRYEKSLEEENQKKYILSNDNHNNIKTV